MKSEVIKYKFIFSCLLILLFNSNVISQTPNSQDSIISITKAVTFPISNPAPQYIVEIRKDKTISFYNILPENLREGQSELIKNWIVDSSTIILENSDFIELYKTINGIDLENIYKIEKPKSENGITRNSAGGVGYNFIIELSNQKVEFSFGSNNRKNISESAKIVRELIEDLEKKYKPNK